MYDARFGRWINPDPYGQFASEYVGMGNNPVIFGDPDGGMAASMAWKLGGMVVGGVAGILIDKDNPWRGAAIGMAVGALAGAGLSRIGDIDLNFYVGPSDISGSGNAAFRVDRARAIVGSILSFGKLKVIDAVDTKDAASQIDKALSKRGGKIDNLLLNSHGHGGTFDIGSSAYDPSNIIGDADLEGISKHMDSESTCILGACWAGTNPQLTVRLGMKFNGATILANRSVSMSNTLLLNGTYSGMTHHFSYGRSVATLKDIGKWSTNFGIVEKVITNKVKVHLSGKIKVKNRNWLTKSRQNRIKKLTKKFNP